MSRAINLNVAQDQVLATCAKQDVAISCIETLPSGCTRVVMRTSDGAAILRRLYTAKIIEGPVARTPLSVASRGVPLTETRHETGASAGVRPVARR